MKRKSKPRRSKTGRIPGADRTQPKPVAVLQGDDSAPDQPFAEGTGDTLSADLRHRLISETAFRHLVERGYEDGSEVEDWTQAETEIDHTLLNPSERHPR